MCEEGCACAVLPQSCQNSSPLPRSYNLNINKSRRLIKNAYSEMKASISFVDHVENLSSTSAGGTGRESLRVLLRIKIIEYFLKNLTPFVFRWVLTLINTQNAPRVPGEKHSTTVLLHSEIQYTFLIALMVVLGVIGGTGTVHEIKVDVTFHIFERCLQDGWV